MHGTDALITFDGVWRHWGRGKKRWAVLRGIDLHVAPGSSVGIAGRNGAGKTTLLRIGTGILTPDQGTVTIDGLRSDRNWREYHRRLGFLSAGDRGLYARFSVRGHLQYATRLAFMPRSARAAAIDDAVVRFGLNDLASAGQIDCLRASGSGFAWRSRSCTSRRSCCSTNPATASMTRVSRCSRARPRTFWPGAAP